MKHFINRFAKMRHYFFLLFIVLTISLSSSLNAATVDTIVTTSTSMDKKIKAVVITPSHYTKNHKYPVVYLLHGYGGDYSNWIRSVPSIAKYADDLNLIIVCPDGNIGSWYFDSPVDGKWKYETYVSKELVSIIDNSYATIKNRSGRAITGLSMGGHGALYLAIKHQDVFGAAGSMSGGVDLRPFPNNWEISSRLGKLSDAPDAWSKNSVINLTHLLTSKSLALIVDCGTDDFFYKVNQQLHENWMYNNIPHDFISRPGSHNWNYWSNAIRYQLLFMNRFFYPNAS